MRISAIILLSASLAMGEVIFPTQPYFFTGCKTIPGFSEKYVTFYMPLPVVSQITAKEAVAALNFRTANTYRVDASNANYLFNIDFTHVRTLFESKGTQSSATINVLVDQDTHAEFGGAFQTTGWSAAWNGSYGNYLRLVDNTTGQRVFNQDAYWPFQENYSLTFSPQSVNLIRGHSYTWSYNFEEGASSYNLGAITTGNFYLYIPEPATALLLLAGLIGLRRRQRERY